MVFIEEAIIPKKEKHKKKETNFKIGLN